MKEDRYTRLKAIKEFGYDINWEELRSYHVGIVGIGGLGCVSSEMATRCGVGKLTLFDFDTVEFVNLNRSMYKPEHVGQPKVEVAYKILKNINPDVDIFYFKNDIMDPNFESTFEIEMPTRVAKLSFRYESSTASSNKAWIINTFNGLVELPFLRSGYNQVPIPIKHLNAVSL